MNIYNLRQTSQAQNNPLKISHLKRTIITKERLEKYFPLANLDEKLIRELNANSQAYEKNFKLLLKNKNSELLVEIEKKLNKNDIRIRKLLGIFTSGSKGTKKHKLGEE